jgi:hypothetical protein
MNPWCDKFYSFTEAIYFVVSNVEKKITVHIHSHFSAFIPFRLENVEVIEFLYRNDLFSIQFFFTNWIQTTKLKKTYSIIQTICQFQFKNFVSNQIIELFKFNFKSPNFFKYQINIKTNAAFFNYCQIGVLNFPKFAILLLQLSQLAKPLTKNR